MSSAEFTEWMAYYAVEPFGAYRDNLHAAIIAATLANIHRGKSKRIATFNDFMLETKQQKQARETGQFFRNLSALAKPKPHG